ncbi:MAG: sigma-54-dependent transcriptional regulator [Steroidobacteraceae bacterium]
MSSARILVVDDEADIRILVKEILTDEGYDVAVAANASEARQLRGQFSPDLILLDIWMPDVDGITLLREWMGTGNGSCPIIMMSGHGTVETAVEATRLGALDFVEKPLSLAKLLRTVERGLENARKSRGAQRLLGGVAAPIGKSRVVQQLKHELAALAPSRNAVLLLGEHGSGREMFARYLHEHGQTPAAPFIVVVASSLRELDAEASLLGRQDATGTVAGILDEAGEGTLFISELGDLPAAAQRVFLGVLETGHYRALGETRDRPFRGRIVSSAHPGIEQAPEGVSGSIRRDLLSHLDRIIVRVPPLREYAEDVPELLRQQVDRLVDTEGLPFRRFGVAAQNRLRNYPWPGNVQELRNLVRRLLLRGGTEEITLADIEHELAQAAPPAEPLVKQDLLALSLREAREHFERAYLQQQLLLCHGKVGQLAKRVGMERTHLYRKLRSLGVDFRSVGDDAES